MKNSMLVTFCKKFDVLMTPHSSIQCLFHQNKCLPPSVPHVSLGRMSNMARDALALPRPRSGAGVTFSCIPAAEAAVLRLAVLRLAVLRLVLLRLGVMRLGVMRLGVMRLAVLRRFLTLPILCKIACPNESLPFDLPERGHPPPTRTGISS
mmetsp:Transcript_23891/g.51094  ORF Transcript_23891/g.51094 Transcript_23891/m.51094 type:complete len:151 (+) Transcript_23891:68-520(+)